MKSIVRSFEATLERGARALGWTIARVPFDPAAVWTERVRLRVKGSINGFAFRTSLFPVEGEAGKYYLLVNRAMQAGGAAKLGHVVQIALQPDLDPRPAELPEVLDALLDEAEGLRDWYEALSEYTRRELGKWIHGVKSDDARARRAQQAAERLLSTMEAEVELPPAIAKALAAHPGARAGWARMTETQRRGELLAVFYYQSPEAQAKRLAKLCQMAEKHAGTRG